MKKPNTKWAMPAIVTGPSGLGSGNIPAAAKHSPKVTNRPVANPFLGRRGRSRRKPRAKMTANKPVLISEAFMIQALGPIPRSLIGCAANEYPSRRSPETSAAVIQRGPTAMPAATAQEPAASPE